MTIIGVPNGTAPSSSAIVRQYEDARRADRGTQSSLNAIGGRGENPLPPAGSVL